MSKQQDAGTKKKIATLNKKLSALRARRAALLKQLDDPRELADVDNEIRKSEAALDKLKE